MINPATPTHSEGQEMLRSLPAFSTPTTQVITRHFIPNYGSALQAFATQVLLRGLNRRCEFIDYREQAAGDGRVVNGHRGAVGSRLYRTYRAGDFQRRQAVFDDFISHELTLATPVSATYEALASSFRFDCQTVVCVGSDQVWNSDYNQDSRPYYLQFVPTGIRRFSLASSLGLRRLPKTEEAVFARELSAFYGVSVRENQAADYLAGLGIDAQVHIDPTLAVPPGDWDAFAGPMPPGTQPYILVYQLNGSPEMDRTARAVSRMLGLPLLRIEYWKNFRGLAMKRITRPTVREFVRLFRDAAFVITDSFHGTAFSLNFGHPFIAFRPPRFESRLESILEVVGAPDRLAASFEQALDIAANESTTAPIAVRLALERARVYRYLEEMHE